MYSHEYGNYAIAFAGACCGSIATLILVSHFAPISKYATTFCAWFGRNSLLLFPLHLLILNAMRATQPVVDIPLTMRFCILLALCIPLANFIDKHLPILAGKGFSCKR